MISTETEPLSYGTLGGNMANLTVRYQIVQALRERQQPVTIGSISGLRQGLGLTDYSDRQVKKAVGSLVSDGTVRRTYSQPPQITLLRLP